MPENTSTNGAKNLDQPEPEDPKWAGYRATLDNLNLLLEEVDADLRKRATTPNEWGETPDRPPFTDNSWDADSYHDTSPEVNLRHGQITFKYPSLDKRLPRSEYQKGLDRTLNGLRNLLMEVEADQLDRGMVTLNELDPELWPKWADRDSADLGVDLPADPISPQPPPA